MQQTFLYCRYGYKVLDPGDLHHHWLTHQRYARRLKSYTHFRVVIHISHSYEPSVEPVSRSWFLLSSRSRGMCYRVSTLVASKSPVFSTKIFPSRVSFCFSFFALDALCRPQQYHKYITFLNVRPFCPSYVSIFGYTHIPAEVV